MSFVQPPGLVQNLFDKKLYADARQKLIAADQKWEDLLKPSGFSSANAIKPLVDYLKQNKTMVGYNAKAEDKAKQTPVTQKPATKPTTKVIRDDYNQSSNNQSDSFPDQNSSSNLNPDSSGSGSGSGSNFNGKIPFISQIARLPTGVQIQTRNFLYPQQLKKMSKSQLENMINPDAFSLSNTKVVPSIYAQQQIRSIERNNRNNYLNQLKATFSNKQSQNMKNLAKMNIVKWDNKINKYSFLDKTFERKFDKNIQVQRNLANAVVMSSYQLTQQQIDAYIPATVAQLATLSEKFGNLGIGPISRKGLPLYVGRFVDKATGRLRILPKASNKYLNPFSYQAKQSYLEARVINKWNQYVNAQQQLITFIDKNEDPNQWEAKQKKKAISKLRSDPVDVIQIFQWYRNQLAQYLAYLPVTQATSLVMGTLNEVQLTRYQDLFTIQKNDKQSMLQLARRKVQGIVKFWSQKSQAVLSKIDAKTPQTYKKRLTLARAFGVYIDKLYIKTQNTIKKVFKSLIPNTLNEQIIQKVQQKKQTIASYFNKVNNWVSSQDAAMIQKSIGASATINDFNSAVDKIFSQKIGGIDAATSKYTQPKKTKIIKKASPLTMGYQSKVL